MRRDDQPIRIDTETTGYTFHFQIANGGSRNACSVRVQASSHRDAAEFCRHNWLRIEAMARDGLAKGSAGGGTIEMELP
jgi:hypothetical protein